MVSRLVGAFSMIVKTDGSYTAPVKTYCDSLPLTDLYL